MKTIQEAADGWRLAAENERRASDAFSLAMDVTRKAKAEFVEALARHTGQPIELQSYGDSLTMRVPRENSDG